MIPIFVDEIIKDCVDQVSTVLTAQLHDVDPNITGVHFMHGHPKEIQQWVTELGKANSTKPQRFPAVWLFRDFKESRNPINGIYAKHQLKLFIATRTEPTYNSDDRKEKSFKPILYPILVELLNQFELSGKFMLMNADTQQYDQIDHYFWGNAGLFESGDKNFFAEWIDCIEINIELQTYLKNC